MGEAVRKSEFAVPFDSDPDPDGIGGCDTLLVVDTDVFAVSQVEHLVGVQGGVVNTTRKQLIVSAYNILLFTNLYLNSHVFN